MFKAICSAIISVIVLFAMGCSSDNDDVAVMVPRTNAAPGADLKSTSSPKADISSDDLAKALGMRAFLVKLPEVPSGQVMAGFTIVDIDGPKGTGFSGFESGEVVKAMYWVDDDQLKYALIGKSSYSTSSLPLAEIKVSNNIASVPEQVKIYAVGEIAAKWSRGKSMAFQGGSAPITEISSDDEIGFAVVVQK